MLLKYILALALWLPALLAAAPPLEGRVVSVADGDTLTILDSSKTQHRIRLAEIDAPESGQPFGTRSKQLLSDLCFGEQARIDVETRDRYGRVVGTVWCGGTNANAELVRQGLAWVYVQYAKAESPLFALERAARASSKGLWSDPHAVEPWAWRRGARSQVDLAASNETRGDGDIRGNRRSHVYHLAHCPSYDAVSEGNRVAFQSEQQAVDAGFRRAGNC